MGFVCLFGFVNGLGIVLIRFVADNMFGGRYAKPPVIHVEVGTHVVCILLNLATLFFYKHSLTNSLLQTLFYICFSKHSFTNFGFQTLQHNHSFTTHVTNCGSLASVHGLMPTCPSHVPACVIVAAFFLAQVWKHRACKRRCQLFCLSQHEQ